MALQQALVKVKREAGTQPQELKMIMQVKMSYRRVFNQDNFFNMSTDNGQEMCWTLPT